MSGELEKARNGHDKIIEDLRELPLDHIGNLIKNRSNIHHIMEDLKDPVGRLAGVNSGPLDQGVKGMHGVRGKIGQASQELFGLQHGEFTDASMELGLMASYAQRIEEGGTQLGTHLVSALNHFVLAGQELEAYEKVHSKLFGPIDELEIKRDETIARVQQLREDI